jgi:hypothetical protein
MIEILAIAFTFRITYMLVEQEGPLKMFERIRRLFDSAQKFGEKSNIGKVFNFDCFDCLSVWVALPVSAFVSKGWAFIPYWMLIATGAMIINRIYERLE